jgi:hypothetical protein
MSERIWFCKIGGEVGELQSGADWPMRKAIEAAYKELTGCDAEFCFSGWGGSLTEGERAVVEDREPKPEAADAVERLRAEVSRLRDANEACTHELEWLRAKFARYRYALEIIAGLRQPVDNTLGNVEVARCALDAAIDAEGQP